MLSVSQSVIAGALVSTYIPTCNDCITRHEGHISFIINFIFLTLCVFFFINIGIRDVTMASGARTRDGSKKRTFSGEWERRAGLCRAAAVEKPVVNKLICYYYIYMLYRIHNMISNHHNVVWSKTLARLRNSYINNETLAALKRAFLWWWCLGGVISTRLPLDMSWRRQCV